MSPSLRLRPQLRVCGAAVVLSVGLLAGCSGSSSGTAPGPDASGSGTGTSGAAELAGTGTPSGSLSGAASASGAVVTGSATGAVTTASASPPAASSTPSRAGSSAAPAPSPKASTPAATATPTLVAPPSPSITAVPGYGYSTAPATVVRALASLTAAQPGVFSVPSVRSVRTGSTSVGTVAVLALNRAFVGRSEVERNLVDGLVRGLSGKGYTLSDHALSGVRVVAAQSTSATAVVWYHAGTVVLVISNAKVAVPLAYAQAYLKQT